MTRNPYIVTLLTVMLPFAQLLAQSHNSNRVMYSKSRNQVHGSGNMTSEKRALTGFSVVSSSGSVDIEVTQGDFGVVVYGEDNIIPHLITEVEAGVLKIRTESGFNYSTTRDLSVKVSLPTVQGIRMSGSGNVKSNGKLKSDKLKLEVSGSGDFNVDLDADELVTSISGSGNFNLLGRAEKLDARISGSGDLRASDLKSKNVLVRVSGSGNADVYAEENLTAEVVGSGDVSYRGKPGMTSLNALGSGNIRSRD